MKRRVLCFLCALAVLCSMSAFAANAEVVLPITWFDPEPESAGIPGDLNGSGAVTDDDAIWLLMYTFFPDDYPVDRFVDYNHDGVITAEDAIYLLMHTFFPGEYPLVVSGDVYYNVDAAFKASGKSMNADVSSCFPADAKGYIINGGTASRPYLVDADTLFRLTEKPVIGTGYVKWIDYKTGGFSGVIPISKLDDPVFLSMNMPGDVRTYYFNPGNGRNMEAVESRHTNLLSIGAIYRNEDDPPPDDMQITICFRDIRLVLHTPEKGWFVADEQRVPSDGMVNHIYFLPWGHKPAAYTLADKDVVQYADHTEVKLTGADLNGKKSTDTDAAVLHFWGKIKMFQDLGITWDQIDGILVSFYVWVKEPEAVGHLTATIGADLREVVGGSTDQAFTGHNYMLTTDPTNVIGHNVVDKIYNTVMDSEKVQQLIGLK